MELRGAAKVAIGTSVALELLRFHTQIKILHWTTTSYATHKALDFLGGRLIELVDKWVEVFMGLHGRIDLGSGAELVLEARADPQATLLREMARLQAARETVEAWGDTGLTNITDELLAAISKTAYLLTLD